MRDKIFFKILSLLLAAGFFLLSAERTYAQEIPILEWARSAGGTADDYANSIVTDNSGNVYTAGYFRNTVDFDPGAGVFNLVSNGNSDIFVSKLDAAGNFVWAKSMGGTSLEEAYAITLDPSGNNVYIAGSFFVGTVDFDPGVGVFNITSAGDYDAFISKLDADGNFVWAKAISGTNTEEAYAIAIDHLGSVYTTGYYRATTDFDPGTGTFNLTSDGSFDVFVSKLDADGNFVWAKSMGGYSSDRGYAIDHDASGNVYIAGDFYSNSGGSTADFDPGAGTFNLVANAVHDIFITKLSATGNFIWAKSIGGLEDDYAYSIAVDDAGNVYATGNFYDTVDFDPGAGTFTLTPIPRSGGYEYYGYDIYILKLDANGNFVWAKSFGADGHDAARSIVLDALENVYITGYYSGAVDFDPGAGVVHLDGYGAIFISKFTANGAFVWAANMGGGGGAGDVGIAIATDVSGNIYSTGYFPGTGDFDPSCAVFPLTSAGNYDVFVQKIHTGTALPSPTITSFSPVSGFVGTSVVITGTNFSTTPANNIVTINSVAATVTASTITSITATVPATATTGKIAVTVACATALSSADFTVTPNPAPGLQWAKAHVGSLDVFSESVATDPSGNVYTTGEFTQTADFDPGAAVFNLTSVDNFDIYISKQNPNGDLVWAIRIGGPSTDNTKAIASDASGNIYVAGTFSGPVDFDPGPGNTTLPGPGAYICKFDTNGNFIWVVPVTNNLIGPWSIVVDPANDVCIASAFTGTTDFDPGVPVFNLTSAGSADIFVLKLSSAGNFIWANRMGSTLSDVANGLALDATGNLHITGSFTGTVDFNPGAGTANLTSAGSNDAFISKLDGTGNFVWARRVGSTGAFDIGQGISTDNAGNVLITGSFTGTVDFDPGASVSTLTSAGGQDIFVLKLNASGNFVWARSMGGTNTDLGYAITTDASGNVYCAGDYRLTADFDPGPGTFNFTTGNNNQMFISKLDVSGNFLWALSSQGVGSYAEAPAISLDGSGNIIIAGTFENGTVDFDPGVCVGSLTAASVGAFVIKLSTTANPICGPSITSFSPTSGPIGTTVTITGTNFSTTPANNAVQFNGITAVVSASTATSITTTVPTGATTGTITITVGGNTTTSATNFTVTTGAAITFTTQPANHKTCEGINTTFSLVATGDANLHYQWQIDNGGFTHLTNSTLYSGVNTAVLTITNPTATLNGKIYRCVVGGANSTDTPSASAALTVNNAPAAPTIGTDDLGCAPVSTTLTPAGAAVNESYYYYDTPTVVNSAGHGQSFITPSLSVSTTYYISTYNITTLCESTRTAALVTVQTCNAPVVIATTSAAYLEGIVTIDLSPLISDPDDNLDIGTLKITSQPVSGAIATLNSLILTVDYTNLPFPGTDDLTIEICDLTEICTEQNLTIETAGDVSVYNAVSPNDDGKNDTFILQYVDMFTDTQKNKVTIFNRWGDVISEIENYNNKERVFKGLNKSGNEVPSGTYYYKIEYTSGRAARMGYLVLKR